MCGIAGIVDFSGREERINRDVLKKMSDIIIHRGPDADGQWTADDRKCGFTFRRLSIIDLTENGNQPMKSSNNNSVIVFNGEIYNHADLRNDLIKRGYKYQSNTDTETIINGYAEYGEEILQLMNGMWGFAIWNADKNELFAARDRIGIKPFYYYYKDGLFIFGSEIKSILAHPSVKVELNIDEVPNYLNFGMSSNMATMFKNIYKLPAGHCLKLSEKDGLVVKRYWNPMTQQEANTQNIDETLVRLLRRSVKDRMMSDVPFGVFLSGGVDSSLNVALMSELMSRPVDTFTVGFRELEKYNELQYARQISELYKTNHHEILIDDRDAFGIIEDLPFYEDEPNADPVCIPLYFLSKLTRKSGTTVVQVGEGSDEQFCGYAWMLQDYLFQKNQLQAFSVLPGFLKRIILATASPLLNGANKELATDYIRRATKKEHFYWSGRAIYSPTHQEMLLTRKYNNLKDLPYKYVNKMYDDFAELAPRADLFQKMMYTELTQRLAEMLLMRVDKIGMANSIEARVPFLDHRIVEYTMALPEKVKIPDRSSTKYLLKKAVEPILPHDIIYRKKQGFAAPVNEWLRTKWYGYACENILNSEFAKLGIIDKQYMKTLLSKHKSGKVNAGFMIYTMLNLNLWYKKFFA